MKGLEFGGLLSVRRRDRPLSGTIRMAGRPSTDAAAPAPLLPTPLTQTGQQTEETQGSRHPLLKPRIWMTCLDPASYTSVSANWGRAGQACLLDRWEPVSTSGPDHSGP